MGETMKDKARKGFRPGITPEDVINLTPEEKQYIRDKRTAEERKLKNETAYKIFVFSEQGYAACEDLQFKLDHDVQNLLETNNWTVKYWDQLKNGITEKDKNGKALCPEDIYLLIRKSTLMCNELMSNIRTRISSLYSYVGTKRLDGKELLTEESYNEIYERIVCELSKTPYRVIPE